MVIFNWNDLLSFGASLFFSHGMFDVLTLQPDLNNNTAIYLTFMFFFNLTYLYLPEFCIIIFIYSSMYHFGEDFRFIFTTLERKYPSNCLFKHLDNRWAGVSLFSSSIYFGYNTWIKGLTNLHVNNPEYIMYTLLFMNVSVIIGSCKNFFAVILSTSIGIFGPYPGLVIYAFAIHAPLAMYRYVQGKGREYTTIVISLWIGLSCIIYLFLPYLFIYLQKKEITSFLISLVMAHVIAITHWQINHKTNKQTKQLTKVIP